MALGNKIDPQDARESLSRWLSGRLGDDASVEVGEVEVPTGTGGLSCDAVLFDAAWTEDGERHRKRLVARVAPPGADGLFPAYDLESEALIMRGLSERS